MKSKTITKNILVVALLASLFYLGSCDRGCNEDDPIYKHWKIPDWASEKYAYQGNETLVFYEIDGTDTAELTFTPFHNKDTTYESISWYEASNGDNCKGYQTDIDVRIDQYYCAEREWYFTAMQNAEDKRIKIEFYKRFAGSDYNFYKWFDPEEMKKTKNTLNPQNWLYYVEDSIINNTTQSQLYRIRSSNNFITYNPVNGYFEWIFIDKNRKIQLKEIKI